MRILIGDDWQDGYLDEHRSEGAMRIQTRALITLDALTDLYFVRERSLWRLWNYLREVGPMWVVRKVVSRSKESSRNQKFLSAGWGTVLEAPPRSPIPVGAPIAFVAPAHPRAFERIVLPLELVQPIEGSLPVGTTADAIVVANGGGQLDGIAERVRGWSAFSGIPLDPELVRSTLTRISTALASQDWTAARRLAVSERSRVRERDGASDSGARPSAALFGYGNYGKTIVLNNVRGALRVAAIHEIDPTLLPAGRDGGVLWDTAPFPRDDERYDVYLIASYHHTHAKLAVHALRQGAAAVVEKPIVTSDAQLEEMLAALSAADGKLFAGFHKRYASLNALALRDLGTSTGEPVHYHAIVFEEPLPARHWYRWPNSCSRIVSNGCHWLDHFLFLNAWSEPVRIDVSPGPSGSDTVNVSVHLSNGALGTLVLTDAGSARIGVRDHVELRAGRVTVAIDDGARYVAENDTRILRRTRINKMTSYQSMYRTIAERIVRGEAGDTLASVRTSARLVLDVERAYRDASP